MHMYLYVNQSPTTPTSTVSLSQRTMALLSTTIKAEEISLEDTLATRKAGQQPTARGDLQTCTLHYYLYTCSKKAPTHAPCSSRSFPLHHNVGLLLCALRASVDLSWGRRVGCHGIMLSWLDAIHLNRKASRRSTRLNDREQATTTLATTNSSCLSCSYTPIWRTLSCFADSYLISYDSFLCPLLVCISLMHAVCDITHDSILKIKLTSELPFFSPYVPIYDEPSKGIILLYLSLQLGI